MYTLQFMYHRTVTYDTPLTEHETNRIAFLSRTFQNQAGCWIQVVGEEDRAVCVSAQSQEANDAALEMLAYTLKGRAGRLSPPQEIRFPS